MKLLRKVQSYLKLPAQLAQVGDRIEDLHGRLQRLEENLEDLRVQQGEISLELTSNVYAGDNTAKAPLKERKIFSQWGEDGLIAGLIDRAQIRPETFVEFGVEDYQEANTRFLLISRGWRGLVLDASEQNIRKIREEPNFYWKHPLRARQAWVTRDNINEILSEEGFAENLGLISIDIDGNDYYVWEALTTVQPALVIIEYNSLFGPGKAVTVPYEENFCREKAHFSHLYYGASLQAFNVLARRKGYTLVAGNSAGNNAFFLRDDLLTDVAPQTVDAVYQPSRFRESRDAEGRMSYLDFDEAQKLLRGLKVYDVIEQKIVGF